MSALASNMQAMEQWFSNTPTYWLVGGLALFTVLMYFITKKR